MLNKVKKLSNLKATKKLISTYVDNLEPALLWHLDESFRNYIRILTSRVKEIISKRFNYSIHCNDLPDDLVDSIMRNVYENYDDKGDAN